MENSEFVRQYGLEAFMEQQKEKYTCSKCGGIISIHDRECSECQEKMALMLLCQKSNQRIVLCLLRQCTSGLSLQS